MSLKIRKERINYISKKWGLKKAHPLIVTHKINPDFFKEFKFNLKLYISKALKIDFDANDQIFLKNINQARNNRLNITPNGAVVPKREYHLEYNIVLRNWCELVKQITKKNATYIQMLTLTPRS